MSQSAKWNQTLKIFLGVCPLEGRKNFISYSAVKDNKGVTIHIYKIYNIGRTAGNFQLPAKWY
jgi:hypothetical protein